MSDNLHTGQGEDYYDYLSRRPGQGEIDKEKVIYMWKEDGKKYKKVFDSDINEFVWKPVVE